MIDSQQFRDRVGQVDGGELVDLPSSYPYSVVFPSAGTRTIVYTTKTRAASELLWTPDYELYVGMIGRYGLPRKADINGIAELVRDHVVYFLGDCDPFDLLVFVWLRQYIPVQFLGVSDAVMSAVGVGFSDHITIALSDNEQRAMSIVRDLWPDFEQSIGPNCAWILRDNRKLELDALASLHSRPVCELLSLLQ